MINSEELDRELLAQGYLSEAEFAANQQARERQAERAAYVAMLTWGNPYLVD